MKIRFGNRHLLLQAANVRAVARNLPVSFGEVWIPRIVIPMGPASEGNVSIYDYRNRRLRLGSLIYTLQTYTGEVEMP